ncbi:MAG: MerR family transcriptional regulator, partial [Albidovulum sp.]
MEKSADAFKTISEVSDFLNTPAHVLRFWESRFSQVKPVKRAGGRRYYRPSDVALICGIKKLLHEDGLTIRGVQKILKEQGVRHVADLTPEFLEPANGEAGVGTEAPRLAPESARAAPARTPTERPDTSPGADR